MCFPTTEVLVRGWPRFLNTTMPDRSRTKRFSASEQPRRCKPPTRSRRKWSAHGTEMRLSEAASGVHVGSAPL
jgi:hypothetical protein